MIYLFLISFYFHNNLVNCDINETDPASPVASLPPINNSQSAFLQNLSPAQFRPRSLDLPSHGLKPVHSYYVGLRPYKFVNILRPGGPLLSRHRRSSSSPGRSSAVGFLQDITTNGTYLFWPESLRDIRRKTRDDGAFFSTVPASPTTIDGALTTSTQKTDAPTDPSLDPKDLTTGPTDLPLHPADLITAGTDPTASCTSPTISQTTPEMTGVSQSKTTSTFMVHLGYPNVTASTAKLFHVDEKGFGYVSVPVEEITTTVFIPASPRKTRWTPTPTETAYGQDQENSTRARKQKYLDMMDDLKEGYLMVFTLEFTKIVVQKDEASLKEIFVSTESIFNNMRDSERLQWMVDPLQAAVWKVSMILSNVQEVESLRTYSSMMHQMLRQRKQVLSDEVNMILEEADLFYNDDEGDSLFSSLVEFENYPSNTSKTGYYLCQSFIQNLVIPFVRLSGTVRRQQLLDRVNHALKKRFPELSRRKHNDTSFENNKSPLSKKKQYQSANERKKQRTERLKQELLKLGFHNESIYVRHYSIGYLNSMLRTMLPRGNLRAPNSDLTYEAAHPTSSHMYNLMTGPRVGIMEDKDDEPGFERVRPEKDTLNMKFESVYRSVP